MESRIKNLFKMSMKEASKELASHRYYYEKNSDTIYRLIKSFAKRYIYEAYSLTNDVVYIDICDHLKKNRILDLQKVLLQHNLYRTQNAFDMFYLAAIKMYGKEYVYKVQTSGTIIIYFPKLTVTSEDIEISHTIKDLYVIFNFTSSDRILSVDYCRGTMTSTELRHGYIHSHMTSSYSVFRSDRVCYGESLFGRLIRRKLPNNFDHLFFFFSAFEQFITTESTFTVPYKYMSNLYNDKAARVVIVPQFYKTFVEDYLDLFIDFLIAENYDVLKKDDEFYFIKDNAVYTAEDVAKEFAVKNNIEVYYTQIDDDERRYYTIDPSKTYQFYRENFQGNYVLTFKGKAVKFKVINTDEELYNNQCFPVEIITEIVKLITLFKVITDREIYKDPETMNKMLEIINTSADFPDEILVKSSEMLNLNKILKDYGFPNY